MLWGKKTQKIIDDGRIRHIFASEKKRNRALLARQMRFRARLARQMRLETEKCNI